jgi:cyclin D2
MQLNKCVLSLQEWELIVLRTLKWEISAVTPHDFLEYIISRMPLNNDERRAVRRHAKTFIALCASGKFLIVALSNGFHVAST